MKLDRIDLKILDLLQRDATQPVARIADQVGLSQTPCWKRIQKHEEAGVIERRVAILGAEHLGLNLTAFVFVEPAETGEEWRAHFLAVAERLGPVCDIYRLAGSFTWLLRVVVPDMEAFEAFYEALTAEVPLRNATSYFASERVKVSSALPISGMAPCDA